MNTSPFRTGALVAAIVLSFLALAWPGAAGARPPRQTDDQVERGKYLVKAAGCAACHTPFKAEYNTPNLTTEQIQTLAFREQAAQDQNFYMAGGRVFPLGPAGIVTSANLTPDPETGLGKWSDDEIKTAFRTGLTPKGHVLFPLMPYNTYHNMADADVDAIVAYLRTLPPIKNEITPTDHSLIMQLQPLPPVEGVTAPDRSNPTAYGKYLVTSVLSCTDCHTPLDPATGLPILERYLGGGQPFEGPWGIVYGGNITPDKQTGVGNWSEEDIKRVLMSGVRRDGRRLAVMPWQVYTNLAPDDMSAVVSFLRNDLPVVNNEVPAVSLAPGIEERVELPPQTSGSPLSPIAIVAAIVGVIVVAGVVVFVIRRRGAK